MVCTRKSQKRSRIANWQSDKLDWDMAFYEFQATLHDFVFMIECIRELNQRVLKDYAITT
jgi:hypothetical protein